jgi:predicted GIY-YIG superfamily endonuclease
LRRRLTEHKESASQATSYSGPWDLIYYEAYVEGADAIGRECYLKSGGGRKLLRSQLRNYFTQHRLRTASGEAFYAEEVIGFRRSFVV